MIDFIVNPLAGGKNGKKINLKIFFDLKGIFDLQLKHIYYIVEKLCFNKTLGIEC